MTTSTGFIGLGLMGTAMALRLVKKGYSLTVLGNRDRSGVERLLATGAREATDARALAEACDVIMLCVGNSTQVEERMRGERGVIAGLRPGATVIDFGTSLPESTRQLAAEVAAAGGAYLDVPLGRTPQHAEKGQLNFMAAGNRAAFDRMRPIFEDQAENIFYLGDSGAGHTVKLLNNFMAMTSANAMSEVFAISDLAGVDREVVYSVLSAGPSSSPMMSMIKTYAVGGDPGQLAFSIGNASKDLGYYLEMIHAMGAHSTIADAVSERLTDAAKHTPDELVPKMVDYCVDRLSR